MQVIIDTDKGLSPAEVDVLNLLVARLGGDPRASFPTQAERHAAADKSPAEEAAPAKPAKKTAAKKTAASRKATPEATEAPVEPSAPEPAAKDTQADSGPTMDDLKARVQELLDADRKPEVLEVMADQGIKRVGLTKPEQIEPFLTSLNALG